MMVITQAHYLQQSVKDLCVFTKFETKRVTIIIGHVDNYFIITRVECLLANVKKEFK